MSGIGDASATQVDRAGRLIRDWVSGEAAGDLEEEPLTSALAHIILYRESFVPPLALVEAELAKLSRDVCPGCEPPAGRPKTFSAIIRKLTRFRGMRLTQMDDIAGVRVIVPNGQQEVRELLDRIRERWPAVTTKDYVAKPKQTGYRAVHAFVLAGRTVEVQLRTQSQNRWADEVEAAADRLNLPLKDGDGPDELLRYFERAAHKLAIEEKGGTPDEAFERDFANLRRQVGQYFRRGIY